MQKIQVLFPGPVMARLRALAKDEDRPVSEIVRRAVDQHLAQYPPPEERRWRGLDWFAADLGAMRTTSERMREVIYGDRPVGDDSHEEP